MTFFFCIYKSKQDPRTLMEKVNVLSILTAGETHLFFVVLFLLFPVYLAAILRQLSQAKFWQKWSKKRKFPFPWSKSVSERNVSSVAKGVNWCFRQYISVTMLRSVSSIKVTYVTTWRYQFELNSTNHSKRSYISKAIRYNLTTRELLENVEKFPRIL